VLCKCKRGKNLSGALTLHATVSPTISSTDETSDRDQQHKQGFAAQKLDPKIYATGVLQQPRSSYELIAGTVIAAALVMGINSDLPGQTIGTVIQNVYDTVTGNFLLVPQGSKMLGQYDSQVAYGQRRVLLVWTRLIMPDGSSITLDRLEGVDSAGYSGLEDKVDSHWGKVFAGAALSTLLGVNSQLVGNRLHLGGVTSPPRSVRPNGSYRRRDRIYFFSARSVRTGDARIIAAVGRGR
jgi:type IV secretory pathway VirB10-like protein